MPCRSSRYAAGSTFMGIILPVDKAADLLDFLTLTRK
jgi:hypothetical protein